MTPEQRKAIKAGKRERLKKLLETLRAWEPKPLVDAVPEYLGGDNEMVRRRVGFGSAVYIRRIIT